MPFFSWLERHQWPVLGFALIAVGTGLIAALLLSDDGRDGIEFVYGSALAPGTPIRVHVTGAVASPGVYELREGDRLVEALAAAGGPASDADVDALNLARRVRDEEQVVVPRFASAQRGDSADDAIGVGDKININTASEGQLDTLPGIGEAYSRRIVDSRRVDGPFKSIRELVERRVLPAATYDQISDLITVGP